MRVAIFEKAGAAPALQEAEHTPLQDNEVLVRIAGVGVCHTDLTGLNGNACRCRHLLCSVTRAQVSSRLSAPISRTWRWAITSC